MSIVHLYQRLFIRCTWHTVRINESSKLLHTQGLRSSGPRLYHLWLQRFAKNELLNTYSCYVLILFLNFRQRCHTQNMIKYLSKLCLKSNIPAMILAMYLFIASTFPSKFWRGKTHPGEELTGRGSMLFKYISSSHHLYA